MAEPASEDLLILVNAQDEETGFLPKTDCHRGRGQLHRAFSIFIFNRQNELLIQKRSAQKPLWPLYWSNSCCSHPRRGESMDLATRRRLREELGLEVGRDVPGLHYLFKFQYQVSFNPEFSENELCHVYIGKSPAIPVVNKAEIADLQYISK